MALVIAITWLPLVVLTLLAGTASSGTVAIPFFADHVPHGRFLIAAPLLLLLQEIVERRTTRALQYLRTADLIKPADEPRLRHLIETATRAWRSRAVHVALVALTSLSAAMSYFWWRDTGISNWIFTRSETGTALTMAGIWNLFIAVPLVRLLLLRAVWKFVVWVWLLVRVSRLDLRIDALHPDQCCGLLFLGTAQLAFLPLVAALGVQLGCMIAVMVGHQGAAISSFKLVGAAFVLLSVAFILGPLGVFARRAWLAIEEAQDRFGIWSALAGEHMSARLAEACREQMPGQLGTSEISSIADGASLFDRVLAEARCPSICGRSSVLSLLPWAPHCSPCSHCCRSPISSSGWQRYCCDEPRDCQARRWRNPGGRRRERPQR